MENMEDTLTPHESASWQNSTTAFTIGLAIGAIIGALLTLLFIGILFAAS